MQFFYKDEDCGACKLQTQGGMDGSFSYSYILVAVLFFFLSFIIISPANSIQFQFQNFTPGDPNIVYRGSAGNGDGGEVELNLHETYTSQVGWAIYAQRVLLWDSATAQLTDFTTHYSFIIDTYDKSRYGHGLAFFLAPYGIQIPPNSAGGFLGLFNVATMDSSNSQIVHVEFDTFPNYEFNEMVQHVGINNNSVVSSVWTPWNASLHSTDPAEVQISYNSTTKNLTVSWKYQTTFDPKEKTSLSNQIDLSKVLPEWVTIGFSAATGSVGERHNLLSWEFNSTLESYKTSTNKARLVIIIVTVSCGVIVIGAIAYALFWMKRKEAAAAIMHHLASINDDIQGGGAGPRRFSYKELASATNNFSIDRKLGQGGFGAVYRGYFADSDLAVKKISRGSRQGRKEYVTEVKVISHVRHRNLLKLLGWCHDDRGEFLLVYEFMPNGSLDSHLFGSKRITTPLTWSTRHKIALGLASAVLYLHEEWERCVIHRDIKSSNVMLDSGFNVKLGDFGLAKLMDHESGPQTTALAGTIGYMAPEYVSTGRASKESDVYSFGVVALEITTGKKAVHVIEDKDGAEKGLIEWVWDRYGRGEVLMAMDQSLQHKDFDGKQQQVECLMIVGLWCAHPDVKLRPSIRQAIQVLNFEVPLPNLPPKRPVATYLAPTSSVSSGEPSITSSLEIAR